MIKIKRIYEQPHANDGTRILVDRIWPRGLTKEKAKIDLWLKEIAPSSELRKWFGHDPARWQQFRTRYETELRKNDDLIELLNSNSRDGTITLLFGARDEKHNQAVVLMEFLNGSRRHRNSMP